LPARAKLRDLKWTFGMASCGGVLSYSEKLAESYLPFWWGWGFKCWRKLYSLSSLECPGDAVQNSQLSLWSWVHSQCILLFQVHLNFTNTNMAIPGTFWDETNSSKLVEELVTCLASSDLGVRRSTYAFVVAQCHRRDFIGLLAHVTKLTLLDIRLSLCTISQYRSMDTLSA
jgi:hypothetical protein